MEYVKKDESAQKEPNESNSTEAPKPLPGWFGIQGGIQKDGSHIDLVARNIKYCIFLKNQKNVYSLAMLSDGSKCSEVDLSYQQAMFLSEQAKSELLSPYRKPALFLIGRSLATALERRQPGDPTDYFSEATQYIDTKVSETAKMLYILCAFGCSFMIAVIILSINTLYGDSATSIMYLGAAFGAIGSFISVMQRSNKIRMGPYSSGWFVAFSGAVRIMLGFVSGLVAIFLVRAGIAMGLANDNLNAIYLFSITCGFSERLVPDLLKREAN